MKYIIHRLALASSLLILLLLLSTANLYSQCKINNNFFQAGETLNYDLYFKWGLISKKSGKAKLKVDNTTFAGNKAYKVIMSSSSEGAARNFFKMDDTISCILTPDLVPMAYFKDAHEDGKYTKEEIYYKYLPDNKIQIRTIRHKQGNLKFDETYTTQKCTYDVMSIVFYARTLDYSKMKKGDKTTVNFISGKKKLQMTINHSGIETLKVGDGDRYKCIKLTLKISDEAFENEDDAMTVYITNDSNRLPIRIDSKLKVGNARVILNSYKGNKHAVNKVN